MLAAQTVSILPPLPAGCTCARTTLDRVAKGDEAALALLAGCPAHDAKRAGIALLNRLAELHRRDAEDERRAALAIGGEG